MDNKKFVEVMDDFYNNNNFLEMCQGYAESDTPIIQSLAESLCEVKKGYEKIYMELAAINKVQ